MESLSTGTPVYVIKGGEIVDLTREVSGTARQEAAAMAREAPDAYKQAGLARRTVRGRKREEAQKNVPSVPAELAPRKVGPRRPA